MIQKILFSDVDSVSVMDWIWKLFMGVLAVVLGYFHPVKDIILFLIQLFIVDMVFGYMAAKVERGEKFSMKIIWKTTVPRLLVSVILIMLTYQWDTVYEKTAVKSYSWIGYFISGILIANIAQNGYKATKWGVFLRIYNFVKNLFTKTTDGEFEIKESNRDEKI